MENKINFTELVDKIAEETGATKKLVHDILTESVNVTKEGLNRDGLTVFKGLGRFQLKWHESRTGRNPQTGEEIEIAAHSSINYKPEAELRRFINREYAHLKPKLIKDEEDDTQPVESQVIEEKPKDEIPPPFTESRTEIQEDKQSSRSWLWIIAILIIVVLIYLFWPSADSTQIAIEEKVSEQETIQPQSELAAEKPTKSETKKTLITEKKPGTPGAIHTVQAGQNLWKISQEYYNNAILWPNIFRVNPNIKNPNILNVGDNIDIPDLQGEPGNLTKQDMNDIAEGFVLVYIAYKNKDRTQANNYLWVAKQWNANDVIDKYKDSIDKNDLKLVDNIRGVPVVN